MRKNFFKPHVLAALLVAAAGTITIVGFYAHRFSHVANTILPFSALRISRLISVGIAFGLIYFSLQLLRRKRIAYYISIASLAALLAISLFRTHHYYIRPLLYSSAIVLLFLSRKTFSVKSENLSLKNGLGVTSALLIATLAYGTAGFYLLERRDFDIDFTLLESLKYAFLQIATLQNQVLPPSTEQAELFLNSLDLVSFISFTLIVASLFRPVRFALNPSTFGNEIARSIIETSPGSVEDYFKLWPRDKHYYFDEQMKSVLAYKLVGDTALVLDGPSGKPERFEALVGSFTAYAVAHGWTPAIIHADEKLSTFVDSSGYKSIFIGNEAFVDVEQFVSSTYRSKHFRYIENKAKREELQFEIWKAPLSAERLSVLRRISNDWTSRDGRREYTFIMGYFSDDYLRDCDVAVLSRAGDYIAYANVIPSYVNDARSIDHMRHVSSMPSVGMHYLLKELIIYFGNQDVKWFNLGLSPLSGLDDRLDPSLPEKTLKTIKNLGARYYSFRGLEQFKNKFEPVWEPRYIYYRGPATNLLKITANLNRAVSVPNLTKKRDMVMALVSLLAATSYVSFPLGYLISRNPNAIVSELGGTAEPYAWVFNALDIVSGGMILVASILIYRFSSQLSRLHSATLVLFALGGAGGLFSAITPLPSTGIQVLDMQTVFHLFFSGLNFFGIFFAASLYVVKLCSSKLERLLYLCLIASGLTAAILEYFFQSGALMQRVQISFVGVWIFLVGYRLYKKTQCGLIDLVASKSESN